MSLPHDDQCYIQRQRNAGPNQGKWTVHLPNGLSIIGGLEKWRAKWLCAAMNAALEHPTDGEAVQYQGYWDVSITSPGYNGRVYVKRKTGL
jgi:hypothetical protein